MYNYKDIQGVKSTRKVMVITAERPLAGGRNMPFGCFVVYELKIMRVNTNCWFVKKQHIYIHTYIKIYFRITIFACDFLCLIKF